MSAASMIEQIIPSVIKDAADRGMDFETVYRVVVRAMTEAFPDSQARFTVAGYVGRRLLIQLEGGCIDEKRAAELLAGAHSKVPAIPEALRKAVRELRLISVSDGRGGVLFPVWQFRTDQCGVLHGLHEILIELSRRPAFSEITPLVFFLRPHPRLGDTPLKALRCGQVNAVLEAAKEYQF